jgi:hypothetical protein
MKLSKIPLEPLIQILTDLFDSGADYIDISGEESEENGKPKDIIHITIKPEYLLAQEPIEMIEDEEGNQHIEMDYSDDLYIDKDTKRLSDDDIDNLI